MNDRMTKKDTNLIKGALRRVFARSELHGRIIDRCKVKHHDPKRPKVQTWCRCEKCGKFEAKSYMDVDHIKPLVAIYEVASDLSIEQLIARLWCEESNLQLLCPDCHDEKTQTENKARREHKKRLRCQTNNIS